MDGHRRHRALRTGIHELRRRRNEEQAKIESVLPALTRVLGLKPGELHFEVSVGPDPKKRIGRGRTDIVLHKSGRPFLAVETKADRVSLRSSACLEQALRYGQLCNVPYVLLMKGMAVELVDVEARAFVETSEDATELDELDARAEAMLLTLRAALSRDSALRTAGFPPWRHIIQLAANQSASEIQLIVGSPRDETPIAARPYIDELFVSRAKLNGQFDEFLASDQVVFAIRADAGLGKTNFLCRLAQSVGRTMPVFFFHGSALARGVKQELLTAVRRSIDLASFDDLVVRFAALMPQDGRVLIFIDAINECPAPSRELLRAELSDLAVELKGKPIRLVVSCRDLDWPFWIKGEMPYWIGHFGRAMFVGSGRSVGEGVIVEPFDDREFARAWKKYESAFHLAGSLSPRMQEICREPFMLRVIAEVYRNGKRIPPYMEPIGLLDRFFKERIVWPEKREDAWATLLEIGRIVLRNESAAISTADLSRTESDALRLLRDEHILVRRRDGSIAFQFELFLEFILARALQMKLGGDPSGELVAREIANLMKGELVNGPGVVENLLLIYGSDADRCRIVFEPLLGARDDKWKAIACSAIRKMATPPKEIRSVLRTLASDPNYVIRSYCADAWQRVIEDKGVEDMVVVARSTASWESRETAANVLARAGSGFNPLVADTLWGLADDKHWRVRRAAGYALLSLRTRGGASSAWRSDLGKRMPQASWRQKYAAVIASLMGGKRELRAVSTMAGDSNSYVQWTVANYLPRLRGSIESGLADALAASAHPWVRARVAASLAGNDDDQSKRLLAELWCQDSAKLTQVILARELGRHSDTSWVVDLLERSDMDDRLDVTFAAAYTIESLQRSDGQRLRELVPDETELRYRLLRERVARRDFGETGTRFRSIENYVLTRTEFPVRRDPYMQVIDSMCNLITSASLESAGSAQEREHLMAILSHDVDEAVRWALVLFLAKYADDVLDETERLKWLAVLASDEHYWVRREVALAVSDYSGTQYEEGVREILKRIRATERASNGPCPDEVEYFVAKSFESLDRYRGD